ncbi:MAG: ImmA/IrrE family metallo-endopeptidase [Marinilabiliales bacterium]|nr:MAG: ImmA/IrrE family metallo-endopeptidase [Marinilabiliales bacterium]
MADRAYINSRVLKWARESAKMQVEVAASKASVPVSKLEKWEEGLSQPTIRQAQNLAKAYRRPFALLFLPDIPVDFQPLQDFRRKGSKTLGTASVFIIREIQQKQAWISEVNEENGEPKVPFIGKFSVTDDPVMVARDILETLEINPLFYVMDNPIKEWIDKAELKGIFVSRTSFVHSRLTLDSDELQGFAIADSYAPFVFINTDDWNAPQLFTLVHELAHLWIAKSGISNAVQPVLEDKDKYDPVELFCSEVAANALMPKEYMLRIESASMKTPGEVFGISKRLGVSSFAFLVRALKLNLITVDEYRYLKKEADKGFQDFLRQEENRKARQKEREGGPSPYLLRVNKNSRLFTQIVLDAFKGGSLEPNLASNLLNTPTNKFPKLEAQLYK